jgi:hypothetical protein
VALVAGTQQNLSSLFYLDVYDRATALAAIMCTRPHENSILDFNASKTVDDVIKELACPAACTTKLFAVEIYNSKQ